MKFETVSIPVTDELQEPTSMPDVTQDPDVLVEDLGEDQESVVTAAESGVPLETVLENDTETAEGPAGVPKPSEISGTLAPDQEDNDAGSEEPERFDRKEPPELGSQEKESVEEATSEPVSTNTSGGSGGVKPPSEPLTGGPGDEGENEEPGDEFAPDQEEQTPAPRDKAVPQPPAAQATEAPKPPKADDQNNPETDTMNAPKTSEIIPVDDSAKEDSDATDETSVGYEGTTQAAYVEELKDHLATIPDFSKLPPYYSPKPEEAVMLSKYCQPSYFGNAELEAEGITPLSRDDIIEPDFCDGTERLTLEVAGNTNSYRHWYAPQGKEHSGYGPETSPQAIHASQKWDIAYVGYMRERRTFHAAFMESLLTKEPIDEHVQAIGTRDGEPVEIPSTDLYKGGEQPAPDFMYDRANWVTSSLLSALALPPEKCSADMKRHAIEQWAAHVDPTTETALNGLYKLDEHSPPRLPWSMRSNTDLNSDTHPQWRQNRVIKEYLGEQWTERADGLDALLQERPKDYVQVVLLQTFNDYQPTRGLQNLARTAELAPEVKGIIFAEDASLNTVHGPATFPEHGQPTSLVDLLGKEMTPQTQEAIIEGQRLRIHVLEDEVASAKEADAANQQTIAELQRANEALAANNRHLGALLDQQSAHLPRTAADLLMLQYGITPNVDNETLEVLVAAIRRDRNKKFHADTGAAEDAQERLKNVNRELDDILKARGLGKNQG